ncbi:putative apoptosis [Trypoxylus dichotomus]
MLSLYPSHTNPVPPTCISGNNLVGSTTTTNRLTVTDNGSPMQEEEQRLKTFTNWPLAFISKSSLAEDGFYYTGKDDIVRCAFCQLEIGYWEMGDVPNAEHKRWNPNCPLVRGAVASNVQSSQSNSAQIGMDDCGFNIEHGRRATDVGIPSLLTTLGIESSSNISYPKYALVDKRLESFADWPISIRQKPKDLAGAGFFYRGSGDQTICFHCGIGLKDWQENDEPWEEHALWSPKCLFLRLQKGTEYISQVVAKNSAVLAPKEKESNSESSASTSTGVLEKAAIASLNINIPNPPTTISLDSCKKNTTTNTTTSVSTTCAQTKDQHEDYVGNVPLCGICYVNERSVLYLPCRHMIACVDCGTTAATCPVCRQEVKAYVKAIMS